jgi:hypothetical protein
VEKSSKRAKLEDKSVREAQQIKMGQSFLMELDTQALFAVSWEFRGQTGVDPKNLVPKNLPGTRAFRPGVADVGAIYIRDQVAEAEQREDAPTRLTDS